MSKIKIPNTAVADLSKCLSVMADRGYSFSHRKWMELTMTKSRLASVLEATESYRKTLVSKYQVDDGEGNKKIPDGQPTIDLNEEYQLHLDKKVSVELCQISMAELQEATKHHSKEGGKMVGVSGIMSFMLYMVKDEKKEDTK